MSERYPDPGTYANACYVAQAFHEAYERLAPEFAYETREASAVPWKDVPQNNKELMIAVAREIMNNNAVSNVFLIERGLFNPGHKVTDG